ncbi:hypothetical protein LR69_00001 [Geobacillus sp. BCO2]|nr:hypothetical protein LR69_00001 [Geobacillus sp. BCO2]
MRKTFEMVQVAVIGALTGAFIGGIVLQGGMDGALWGDRRWRLFSRRSFGRFSNAQLL